MAAPCPLLGDGITDGTLLHIAGFLPSARDLLCLKLTNSRFAAKVIAAAPRIGAAGGAAAPEMLSIPEEAGRLWVAGCSGQERGWVPRRELESLLGLMQEVALLRVPLVFGRAHDTVTLSEGGAVATKSVDDHSRRIAASNVVMRSGRHFAQFTAEQGKFPMFGVIRPGWDVGGGEEAYSAVGHCFYWLNIGWHFPAEQLPHGSREWDGMQDANQGDCIGMLLDLDQGSMTVWKNDDKLGVMQVESLSGPVCWAVDICELYDGDSVRIMSAAAPPSPTEEELAAAKAWQAANHYSDSDDE